MSGFKVTLAMVGEGEHQPSERKYDDVVSIALEGDSLIIRREGGASANFSNSTWGALKVVRVPSAADRI